MSSTPKDIKKFFAKENDKEDTSSESSCRPSSEKAATRRGMKRTVRTVDGQLKVRSLHVQFQFLPRELQKQTGKIYCSEIFESIRPSAASKKNQSIFTECPKSNRK